MSNMINKHKDFLLDLEEDLHYIVDVYYAGLIDGIVDKVKQYIEEVTTE